ncbi:alpha/beta-hydrolase [Periconia macrospinosa]|uniref:Alpha/beta-hydrolase n=1 Tax=Periconia macrospinosa TaxID=97972 RepID=A0A2V1DIH4_9PLEO|nr:alpha/beta-hydrolase [Periconia macrospinosa]
MKLNIIGFTALSAVAVASPVEKRQGGGGDGPYKPGTYKTDSSLQQHTIYLPTNPPADLKLPVLVWGNGGCGADGTSTAQFLQQVASYGYIAIASGGPGQQGSTTSAMMKQSIDWVTQNAGKGAYANVDATKIMASGFSCGGVEAMDQIWDPRVKTIGVVSSGLLTNQTAAKSFKKPIVYIMGGSGDIAYANGERDYNALPAGTPAWKGNINVGHGGTLFDQNGGRFGKAGLNWLQWVFRGDEKAKAYFTSGYSADGWQVQSKSLDNLKAPL